MLIMNDKTLLARLKRSWQGQEKDRIIWNEGIVPNFIALDEIYNPISFTCYQLYKILQDSFSYQNLYKYLRKYEMEESLTSELVINKDNRKERIYSFSKKSLTWGLYKINYIQNKNEKVEAQKLFELIQEYNHPKKIYNAYNKKKISKDYALDALRYIINEGGDIFEKHRLESSFLLNSLKYIIKISKKDRSLFSFLESIVVSHEDSGLQEKAVEYIKKYFPKLFEINLSRYLEGKHFYNPYSSKSLDDYILTNKERSRYKGLRRHGINLEKIKDQKLLDLHLLAGEKLKKFSSYSRLINYYDYDPLMNRLIYSWNVSVVYNEIKGFEQKPYASQSVDLRNKPNNHYYCNKEFYFALKIFKTVLDIKEQDILVAIPPPKIEKGGWWSYYTPFKMFSKKTKVIIYLRR